MMTVINCHHDDANAAHAFFLQKFELSKVTGISCQVPEDIPIDRQKTRFADKELINNKYLCLLQTLSRE